jgi:palmitoyl-protein thioesterase
VNDQVELVAEQIRNISELEDGFDAIGFSQGGQFLRAYQERHAHDSPSIHNLITFGSQHMGVSDLPACKPNDWLCQFTHRLTRRAVYGSWAQHNSVQVRLTNMTST